MKENCVTYLSKNYDNFNETGYFYQFVKDRKLTKVRHKHNFFEIFFVLAGTVLHNIDGKAKTMQAFDFLFLSPENVHFFENQSEDAYIFSVSVTSEKFNRILSAFEFSPKFGKIYKATDKRFTDLSRIPTSPPARQNLLINSVLMGLLSEIVKNDLPFDHHIPHALQNALEKIRRPEYIMGGVEKLAELAGYSRMHLGRLIKKYYGKTPVELLCDIRMNLAAEYLEKTSYTLEQIAQDVGFSSVSQFHETFKKHFHCTPNTYRKNKHTTLPINLLY